MNPTKYTLTRHGQTIDLAGKEIFKQMDGPYEVAVHEHPELGNILFIDGEAQISSRDFVLYHQSMLAFVKPGARILVIGDGDGGFCSQPLYQITQVEMSSVVRAAGTLAFGSKWPTPVTPADDMGHVLYSMTLREYLELTKVRPDGVYDAIFLAITDDFNANPENFNDVLDLWDNKLVPGGVMVSQVGCLLDPEYGRYNENHLTMEIGLTPRGLGNVEESTPYIPVFHSRHMFRALYKKGEGDV